MPERQDSVIRATGLTKVYRNGPVEVQALRGVDFAAGPGEFVVILGPSGSGKSTFLNILGGLDRASAGTLEFRGQDLTRMDDRGLTAYRRDHVGFVFQFYNLVPSLTALENVALVTEIARRPMPPAEALAMVGLSARADHFPAQLSGGEQQRVAIARGLVNRPPVILADEPTAPLDSERAMAVIRILNEMARKFETAIIVVTHDEKIIPTFRRIYHIRDGVTHEEAGEGQGFG
jgi:putative ABC transport system ATP-binding protein